MKSKFVQGAVAVALAGVTMLSQAAVVNLSGWAFGNGNHVNVGDPAHKGGAGGFKGSVDFSPADGFTDMPGTSFITYCVEINEHFSLPSGDMSGYAVQSASAYATINGRLGAAKSSRLGQLMSHVNSNASLVDTDEESTALQLAVWNVVYDSDNTLHAGLFREKSIADNFKGYANTLLDDSVAVQNKYDVYILRKSGSQDFLLLRELPEPTSLALAFVALGGAGFVGRRRRA